MYQEVKDVRVVSFGSQSALFNCHFLAVVSFARLIALCDINKRFRYFVLLLTLFSFSACFG